MFILTILEKIKKARLTFSQESITVLPKKRQIIKKGELIEQIHN